MAKKAQQQISLAPVPKVEATKLHAAIKLLDSRNQYDPTTSHDTRAVANKLETIISKVRQLMWDTIIEIKEANKSPLSFKEKLESNYYENNKDSNFYEDLLMEYGVLDHPKANKVYQKAWDDGHSGGLEEVAIHFGSLVELIKD